jgi:hypothetical protein
MFLFLFVIFVAYEVAAHSRDRYIRTIYSSNLVVVPGSAGRHGVHIFPATALACYMQIFYAILVALPRV